MALSHYQSFLFRAPEHLILFWAKLTPVEREPYFPVLSWLSGLVQRGAERTQVGIFSDFPTAGREPGKQATLPSTSQTPDQGGLFRRSQHRRNYLTDKPSPMPYCLRGKGHYNLPPYYLLAFLRIHIIHSMFSTLISMISHQEWQDSKICGALFLSLKNI